MLYSILIYDSEAVTDRLSKDEEASRVQQHVAMQEALEAEGRLGPVARLMPSTAAVTLRPGTPGPGTPGPGTEKPLVIDGPFAETKEQLLGFYLVECDSLQEALDAAQRLPLESGSLEVRPVGWYKASALGASGDTE